MNGRSVTHDSFSIERGYDVSPARGFAAWADPQAKARWFAGPAEWARVAHELDFRVGGRERSTGGPEGGPVHATPPSTGTSSRTSGSSTPTRWRSTAPGSRCPSRRSSSARTAPARGCASPSTAPTSTGTHRSPSGLRASARLQDTPPGTAALSLAVRADVAPDALDELVLVSSVRGAPLALAPQDLAVFTAGLEPPDEEAAKVVVGNAWKSLDGITTMDALDRASEAVHDSLREGPLPRDDFHQALRERLPDELIATL